MTNASQVFQPARILSGRHSWNADGTVNVKLVVAALGTRRYSITGEYLSTDYEAIVPSLGNVGYLSSGTPAGSGIQISPTPAPNVYVNGVSGSPTYKVFWDNLTVSDLRPDTITRLAVFYTTDEYESSDGFDQVLAASEYVIDVRENPADDPRNPSPFCNGNAVLPIN